MKNTEKELPCVHCGSKDTSIIREGNDPRLKCNRCNGMFDASQSIAAQDAGAIPDKPPELQDPNPEPTVKPKPESTAQAISKIPRSPVYVAITKDRQQAEFCTKRDLKKLILGLEAQGLSYDVFELTARKAEAKVHIE